jgi:hypothetical protein
MLFERPFETLRERLLQAGIAPRRVRRYLVELEDHLAELMEREIADGTAPDQAASRARLQLGSEDELLQPWLEEPRLRSFVCRARWLVFGLFPPFAAILLLAPPTFLLASIARASGFWTLPAAMTPDWFLQLVDTVMLASNVALLPIVVTLFVVLAARHRLSARWPLLVACLLLILGVHMRYVVADPGMRGWLRINLSPLFLTHVWKMYLAQWPWFLAQGLLTLLPVAWFARVAKSR